MTTDTKSLKILTNQIQEYKRNVQLHHDKYSLLQEGVDGSKFESLKVII